jgi:hypothetical protein
VSFRHVENIGRISTARLVPGPKYVTIEIDYMTEGGVSKTLKLAHGDAEDVRGLIGRALDSMPALPRRGSFFASLKRAR